MNTSTDIPCDLVAGAAKSLLVLGTRIQSMANRVGVVRPKTYFVTGDGKKLAFGDENVMSLVPNDIFVRRGRVLR